MVTEPVIESVKKGVEEFLFLDDLVNPIKELILDGDVVLKQKPDERVIVEEGKKAGADNVQQKDDRNKK